MHTVNQFETALLVFEVKIEEMKIHNGKVREVIGYKNGKRVTWNESGQCFFYKTRIPENDIMFNENTPEPNETN